MKINGNGFPDAAKVYLEVYGDPPGFEARSGSRRDADLDSCGRFEHPWQVPPTLEQNGGTRFRINATGQDRTGRDIGDGANDANIEFTLVR